MKTINNTSKIKVLRAAVFIGIFALSFVNFSQSDGGTSFGTLKAYAQSGGSGNEEELKGHERIMTEQSTETQNYFQDGKICTKTRTVTTKTCVGIGTVACSSGITYGPWSTPVCE